MWQPNYRTFFSNLLPHENSLFLNGQEVTVLDATHQTPVLEPRQAPAVIAIDIFLRRGHHTWKLLHAYENVPDLSTL